MTYGGRLGDLFQNQKTYVMIVEFDINNYNEDAQKFYKTWIPKDKVLGIIRRAGANDSRKEDYLFFRDKWRIGRTEYEKIRVATMPRKDSDGGKSVFYGDLEHFCKVIYANVYGRGGKFLEYERNAWWFGRREMNRLIKVVKCMLNAD